MADLRGQQMSQQRLIAPPFARPIGHEHDQALQMPSLLLGNHVLERPGGLVWSLEPVFRDTHGDEGVGSEDQREPSQHSLCSSLHR